MGTGLLRGENRDNSYPTLDQSLLVCMPKMCERHVIVAKTHQKQKSIDWAIKTHFR